MEFDLDLLQSDSCVSSGFKTIESSWIELIVLLRACAEYPRINHFADKRHFSITLCLLRLVLNCVALFVVCYVLA